MSSLTRTEWIIQIILCNLLLIFIGISAIYYIECRANIHSCDLAKTAANDIAGLEEDAGTNAGLEAGDFLLLPEPEQYLTYNVYYQEFHSVPVRRTESSGTAATYSFRNAESRDDIWAAETAQSVQISVEMPVRLLRAYYGQQNLQIDGLLNDFSDYIHTGRSFYAMQGSLRPFGLVSIAGQPLPSKDKQAKDRETKEKQNSTGYYVYVAKLIPHAPLLMLVYTLLATLVYYAVVATIISQKRSRDRITQIYHQYIANISHELKTPIASIQAITEVLNDGSVHDETALSRYYGIISRESRLLEHSVLQIIELSKLQDHSQRFEKKTVSPHVLLDPVAERFGSRCEEAEISFFIDDSVWTLPDLYTDAFRLTQLLEILLDNAFKFVSDEGHIFIDATSKYGQATLRVNDDGRGISKKDIPHIFERFYKTSVGNPTGSGLGLAIAHEIVDGLGEKIWVDSEEGKGTIVFVTVTTREK